MMCENISGENLNPFFSAQNPLLAKNCEYFHIFATSGKKITSKSRQKAYNGYKQRHLGTENVECRRIIQNIVRQCISEQIAIVSVLGFC